MVGYQRFDLLFVFAREAPLENRVREANALLDVSKRMISATDDGFGNLTAKTVTAGSAIQFSAAYTVNNQQGGISYDANGNSLTGAYDPVNQQYLTYQYDVENRIVSASDSGLDYTYGYDP